ncbi:MAG: M20/M25/M40 family metallo-hydrolase, partial [Anaerolineae bacterium]|nr:M20/M25/M40 family metallo-hydrolase [Anaerolineae bacterium]
AGILREAGLTVKLLGMDDKRPNLIARLRGRGESPPILLEGHVDVVTTENQKWSHPPFEGKIVDGVLWGRGALDDKGSIALFVGALLKAKEEGFVPPGDVILAAVVDEEVNGKYGAKYLVDNHPEQFEGVKYAIGEGGGFAVYMGGKKFYPIMVAEKHQCKMRATVHGRGGHGSIPLRGQAMAKLADVLHILDRQRLPVHITPTARELITTLKDNLPFPQGTVIGQLLNPMLTDRVLDILGEQANQLNPILHNTVSPTIVNGGSKINVIPSTITLDMDGRLLPGFTQEDMLRELGALLGDGVDLEVTHYEDGPPEADMGRYDVLERIIGKADPEGTPMPYLLSGVTDARHFARLGMQMYGFIPLDLPNGSLDTIHAADERVPVKAVEDGTEIVYTLLKEFMG